jgi:hypothetical protein
LASLNMIDNNISNWFFDLKQHILADVERYNELSICKFYYENKTKDLLPNKFKNLWENWHLSQVSPIETYEALLKEFPKQSIKNFLREDAVYAELNDNMLIIGSGILCKAYIYQNLFDSYNADFFKTKVQFFTKAWELYQEALQKYYPFFHHYNWFCKLYKLDHHSKFDILRDYKEIVFVEKQIASLPPLYEYILNEWRQKPDWHNNIRPITNSEYKEFWILYRLGLCKIISFNKLTSFSKFYLENFLIKSVDELTGEKKWFNFIKYIKLKESINDTLNQIFIKKTNKVVFKLIKSTEKDYQIKQQFLKFTKNKQFNIKLTNIEKKYFFK